MKAKVDLKSNPISLKIISHDGKEPKYFETVGHNNTIDIGLLVCLPKHFPDKLKPVKDKRFPKLSECESAVRRTIHDHKLSETEKCITGETWAFIESKLL
jgi:hypothetical protein